ncbi:hypothetical protein [Aestuariispira insulae]|nr:hypothetical protein [Aestuariispira insulae]
MFLFCLETVAAGVEELVSELRRDHPLAWVGARVGLGIEAQRVTYRSG